MKKILLILLFDSFQILSCTSNTAFSSESLIDFKKIEFIKVFKCDRTSRECYDAKAVSIIDKRNNKLSPCFRLMEILDKNKSMRIAAILSLKSSYQKLRYDAFTTDYAIILFDKEHHVIGFVNFSFICSGLYSFPVIATQKSISPKDFYNVGLSEEGKKNLENILGVK